MARQLNEKAFQHQHTRNLLDIFNEMSGLFSSHAYSDETRFIKPKHETSDESELYFSASSGRIFYFSFVTALCFCSGQVKAHKLLGQGQENITFQLKILVLVAANTAGDVLRSPLKTSNDVTLINARFKPQSTAWQPCRLIHQHLAKRKSGFIVLHKLIFHTWTYDWFMWHPFVLTFCLFLKSFLCCHTCRGGFFQRTC